MYNPNAGLRWREGGKTSSQNCLGIDCNIVYQRNNYLATETSGWLECLCLVPWVFLKELGKRVSGASGESRSLSFLLQRISVELQTGNAASICFRFFVLTSLYQSM